MKAFRRIAAITLFAVFGVGAAVALGLSVEAKPGYSAAPTQEKRNSSDTAVIIAEPTQSDKTNAVVLPPPPPAEVKDQVAAQAVTVLPSPAVGEQRQAPSAPVIAAPTLPSAAVEAVRRHLKTPAASAPPAVQKTDDEPAEKTGAKSGISGEGDGKLRIRLYDEDIRKALEMLSEQSGLNILAGKSVAGNVTASLNNVDVNSALDAILRSNGFTAKRKGNYIFVGTPDDFTNIEQSFDKIGARVYRPNYITAVELQTLIKPLLTDKTGVISVTSASEAGIATNDANAGGDKFAGNEALLVRDYEAVLSQIDQVVDEVDVRPAQVSIEAMILSVKLKDSDKLGVNFQLLRDNPNIKFGLGTPSSSLGDVKFDDGGLKFGFLDSTLGAFLDALETVGDTNVVANPRLMVMNKQRADIQIGEQKGYLSTTVTETSSTQKVEFLNIGAQLRLRPFISSDGNVRLEIHPELSDGNVDTSSGYTLPNKTITQVTTNIMVRDGCTLILGGLMRDQMVTTTTQVPFFGNLPLVGAAFRNSTETLERTEVLVLITPRIVYEPSACREGEKAQCEFERRHSTYADKTSPFGKRSVARRYYRLAQAAWAEGNRDKALRFAEMAVQFDPLNREAIDLRSDIWRGQHTESDESKDIEISKREAGKFGSRNASKSNPLDEASMANWVVDDLEKDSKEPTPNHPYDRGTPGSRKDVEAPKRLK